MLELGHTVGWDMISVPGEGEMKAVTCQSQPLDVDSEQQHPSTREDTTHTELTLQEGNLQGSGLQ